MALTQSALSELLDAFRTGDGDGDGDDDGDDDDDDDDDDDMIRESVRTVLQELLEFEAAGVIGAERYDDRLTERNGTRPKLLASWGAALAEPVAGRPARSAIHVA